MIIVDDFTGRMMPGRRWSDGLHQAVEAKEGVKIQQESLTYATITLQNYFRLYDKLAGMTGTAVTEAEEFFKIYKLEVVMIPTHRAWCARTRRTWSTAARRRSSRRSSKRSRRCTKSKRPVLVGTVSIEKSEYLAELLEAKGHQAPGAERQVPRDGGGDRCRGRPAEAAVTIATNMAGRGTDIILGGKTRGPRAG